MELNSNTIRKGVILLAIVGLILGFANSALAQNSVGKILSGRIDEKAAFAVREEGVTREINCDQWPEKFWVFLFGAYLFLLVFNLSFGLKNKKKIQWFWELLITLLALWTWKKLDVCEMQPWFYYCVIESGVIIYFFYAYYLLVSKEKES